MKGAKYNFAFSLGTSLFFRGMVHTVPIGYSKHSHEGRLEF